MFCADSWEGFEMRVMAGAVLVTALVGCASPDGEGQSQSPGVLGVGGPLTDAASVGNGKWLVSCYAALSACTWRSNQVCPTGFAVTNSMSSQEADGSFSADGGSFDSTTKYTLAVTCT